MALKETKGRPTEPSRALVRAAMDRLGTQLRTFLPTRADEGGPGKANDAKARSMVALATMMGIGDFARVAASVPDDDRSGLRVGFGFVDAGGASVDLARWDTVEIGWLTLTVRHEPTGVDAGQGEAAVLRIDMDANGVMLVRTRAHADPSPHGAGVPPYVTHPYAGPDDAVAALPSLLSNLAFGPGYEHLLSPAQAPRGGTPVGDTTHWVDTTEHREIERANRGKGT